MSDTTSVLAIVLGTAFVILMTFVVASLVMTLSEVRATARTLRATLERITPDATATLKNVREVTDAAAKGAAAFSRFGESLGGQAKSAKPVWGILLAGATALFTAIRRRRAARHAY